MLQGANNTKSGDQISINLPKTNAPSNESSILNLENTNKQLLENQSHLHAENQKLQSNLEKLAMELELLKRTAVDSGMYKSLRQEKSSLAMQNSKLKSKLKQVKSPSKISNLEIDTQKNDKESLNAAIDELDNILSKIKSESKKIDIQMQPDDVTEAIKDLSRQLELEQQKSDCIMEQLRKERNDEEKGILKTKVIDMKDKITNLEVENTKLRFQIEQLNDDLSRMKKQMERIEDDLRLEIKKNREFEDEKDKIKEHLSDVENDNLRLKKEMIEELNEANRAKRISIDTEIALQHISEAYDSKRRECMKYFDEIDELNKLLKTYKEKLKDAGVEM